MAWIIYVDIILHELKAGIGKDSNLNQQLVIKNH